MKLSYKSLKRYKEIVHILIKYGFTFVVEKLNIENFAYKIPITNPPQEIKDMSTAQKLRKALEELGPTYIKLGQILSTRKDLFDSDIIEELSKLRDNVEIFDTNLAKDIFFNETGLFIDEEFIDFNQVPIAAASIGQVYEAKLSDNSPIIIKIQRPDIEDIIKSDIEILKKLVIAFSESIDININLVKLVDEFYTQLMRELDYNFEAMNCIKFKKIFKGYDKMYIPTIYDKYTTKKVLVMEKIIGLKLSDSNLFKKFNWDTKKISDVGVDALFKQIFEYGFFHADLHPGNIFVISKECISYIDFGTIGIIDNKTLNNLVHIFMAIMQKNTDKIICILEQMNIITSNIDVNSFKYDLLYLIHYYYDLPLDKINVGDILNEIFKFFRKHNVYLPTELVTLGKTLMTLEGTGRQLDPNFSLAYATNKIAKRYYLSKLDIKNIFDSSKSNIEEMFFDIRLIPKRIVNILKNIENNDLKIEIDDIKFTNLEKTILDLSTKLSLSLVLASLVVGSSLIVSSPNLSQSTILSKLAITGFFISFLIGLLLVIKILGTHYRD